MGQPANPGLLGNGCKNGMVASLRYLAVTAAVTG